MTVTKTAELPKSELGNDPNDYREDPDFLAKVKIVEPVSALHTLLKHSTTNRLNQMEANLENDFYVFEELALSGQITIFYGWPNTGKTLFFLRFIIDAINADRISAEKVIYVNADDSYKGLFTKAKIADKFGFNMISPAEAGVSPQNILELLEGIAEEGDAEGVIILLDTLKKFADMMSKRSQAELYETLRRLNAKGGTVIIAGHANKHKDPDGKLVYEGTSDTKNDVDCMYSMHQMSAPENEIQTVEFCREKDRGNVIPRATFQYRKTQGAHYLDMVQSIKRLDDSEAEKLIEDAQCRQLEDKFESELIFVKSLLGANGPMNQTEIIKALQSDSDLSGEITMRSLRRALKQLTGIAWISKRGDKDAMTYSLKVQEAVRYCQGSEGY